MKRFKKPITIFYFLVLYALAELTWWGYLLIASNAKRMPMILGEGSVFLIILLVGIYFFQRTIKKESEVHQQQQNFLLSVTHELKSPLAAIKLVLQTLVKRDLTKDKRDQLIGNSIEDVGRLDDLVENMLLATRIENNSYSYPKELFDFSELVKSIFDRAIITSENTRNFQQQIEQNISIMGDEGEDYLSHSEVEFVNCRVPVSHLLGEEGSGFQLAQVRLGPGRIHHCMRWIGICERALGMMCDRAIERELNPGHSLAMQQTIQNWIAESAAEIKASRLLVLNTAHKIEKDGAKAAKEDISTIKFFVSDVLMKVVDRAIQVHGGLGITDDTLLSFWYRHERGARIYDGPDEVHKTVLAKSILKSRRG